MAISFTSPKVDETEKKSLCGPATTTGVLWKTHPIVGGHLATFGYLVAS